MLFKFLSVVWALPLVITMRLLNKFILIKMATLQTNRIGGLILQSLKYLRFSHASKREILLFGSESNVISNNYWMMLLKRSGLNIVGNWLYYLIFWNSLLPNSQKYKVENQNFILFENRDWSFDYAKLIQFTGEENLEGLRWLRKHGLASGQPFICLLSRDSAYLSPQQVFHKKNLYDYHDYRNTSIHTFDLTIKWLIKNGYFVIRMGSKVNDRISLKDGNFVDYPFCNDSSPFLDIWLFANCYFTISTGTGQDVISPIFKKPLLCINVLPLCHTSGLYISTYVPKKLFDMKSKIPLSIEEYFYHSYSRDEDYDKNSILIQNLNEFEILEYVQEFEKNVKNGFWVKANTSMLQEEIWNLYKSKSQDKVLLKDKNPQALFSEIWISRNILRKKT